MSRIEQLRDRLTQAEFMNVELGRALGLMEASRNHARWKAGVRKRKMREMRLQIADLRASLEACQVVLNRHGLSLEYVAQRVKDDEVRRKLTAQQKEPYEGTI